MDQPWKQFGASVTALKDNIFLKARLRLTAIYVLIVAIIIFGFSVFIYQNISRNLQNADEENFAGIEYHRHFVENTLGHIRYELLFTDLIIIFISAGFSYIFAGETFKPIQKSVEAQKIFAANASHELRTPLAVMKNDIEVLERNKYPTKELINSTFKSNLEEIERMSGIVENLLLLARSDNGLVPVFITLDVNELLKATIKKMQSLAHNKNIKFIFKQSDSLKIRGNSALLERAILNILKNSIEYTPLGGSVTVETLKSDLSVVIRISDTGSGIDEKDLPYVFTRFYKSESSNGSGLGLPIIKEIIDQHDGKISIESVKDKSTTVTIHVPIAQ